MREILMQFLSEFDELNENQVQDLANNLEIIEIKKDNILVHEGEVCNVCYFVLKGCLHQYILKDGAEKTIGIYTESQAVNYYSDTGEKQKSESFLTSIEDSVLLIGKPEKDKELYSRFPVLAEITRNMIEADFGETQKTLAKYITSSPEERYLNILNERTDLFQRVPQYIIASFLGVTPESLSRIRKRLVKKQKNN
jgi:CRP-like cAMP-binding protein